MWFCSRSRISFDNLGGNGRTKSSASCNFPAPDPERMIERQIIGIREKFLVLAHRLGQRGGTFSQAFGKVAKEAINSSTEQLHEPKRMSIPAVRSCSLSGPSIKPQINRWGFSSSITWHADFAPDRSHGWSFLEPSALISKTPSHFSKNGQRSGIEPEFTTSPAVRTAAADDQDTAVATRSALRGKIGFQKAITGSPGIQPRSGIAVPAILLKQHPLSEAVPH